MTPMRHLLVLAILCATLPGCVTPAPPVLGSFTLEPGQDLAVGPDTRLRFDTVDDSRCPPNVHCIWAGRLGYRFSLRRGGAAPDTFELSPMQREAAPAALDGRRILLDPAAIPAPSGLALPARYRATITIVPA